MPIILLRKTNNFGNILKFELRKFNRLSANSDILNNLLDTPGPLISSLNTHLNKTTFSSFMIKWNNFLIFIIQLMLIFTLLSSKIVIFWRIIIGFIVLKKSKVGIIHILNYIYYNRTFETFIIFL